MNQYFTTLFSLLLIYILTPTKASNGHLPEQTVCGHHKFFNETTQKCQECGWCGPGEYVKSRCRSSRDTTCRKCKAETYATFDTRSPGRCRRCTYCGMRAVVRKCTKSSDTVCGECPLGTYWDFISMRCTACSYCFPDMYDNAPLAEGCKKTQIPSSHHCIQFDWPPYDAPYLVEKYDENGEKYFISSSEENGVYLNPVILPEVSNTEIPEDLPLNTPSRMPTALKIKPSGPPAVREQPMIEQRTFQIIIMSIVLFCTLTIVLTICKLCCFNKTQSQYSPIVRRKKINSPYSKLQNELQNLESSKHSPRFV